MEMDVLVTSAPMTMVHLRPRTLILHRYPAKIGPKMLHTFTIA